jgi:hypothetical protein
MEPLLVPSPPVAQTFGGVLPFGSMEPPLGPSLPRTLTSAASMPLLPLDGVPDAKLMPGSSTSSSAQQLLVQLGKTDSGCALLDLLAHKNDAGNPTAAIASLLQDAAGIELLRDLTAPQPALHDVCAPTAAAAAAALEAAMTTLPIAQCTPTKLDQQQKTPARSSPTGSLVALLLSSRQTTPQQLSPGGFQQPAAGAALSPAGAGGGVATERGLDGFSTFTNLFTPMRPFQAAASNADEIELEWLNGFVERQQQGSSHAARFTPGSCQQLPAAAASTPPPSHKRQQPVASRSLFSPRRRS